MGRFNTTFITGGVRTIGRRAGTTIIHAEDPSLVLDLQFQRDAAFVPRRGPLPTFTRASAAWRVNSAGLIVPAAVNEPRPDYDPTTLVSLGIKNEPQSTNLAKWSEDLTNAAWAKVGTTVAADQTISPDGTVDADLLSETAASSFHYVDSPSLVATIGLTYTGSIFLKKGSGATAPDWIVIQPAWTGFALRFAFNVTTGQIGVTSAGLTVTAKQYIYGFWRVTVTAIATGAAGNIAVIFNNNVNNNTFPSYAGNTTSNVFVWGAQVEALDHATSYIPTTSAAAVRSADLFSYTGGAFSGFWNASEGTLVFQGMKAAAYASVASTFIIADDATSFNRIVAYSAVVAESVQVSVGGVAQAQLNSPSPVAPNVAFGAALRYKANDFAYSLSGAAALTDVSGSVPTVNQMTIGNRLGAAFLSGWIRSVQYYNRTKTDAQLQTLSTPT